MSVYNFFRNIFGIPNNRQEGTPYRSDGSSNENPNEFRNPIWNMDEDDDDDDFRHTPSNHFGFHVDSDPIGIHRFFEQQMDEMLKSFGMFGSIFGSEGFPAVDQHPMLPGQGQGPKRSLRDEMLKPGYDSYESVVGKKKVDSDLDDRISAGELNSILRQKPSLEPGTSSQALSVPGFSGQVFGFGKSVTSKTVRRADGSVEFHRTVRDSQGNEETTITRQIGEQSYSITTQKDSSGEEKCTKNFVNIHEDNLQDFEKKFGIKF